jgi:predicted ATPase
MRALAQIAALPATPALRREQIKLQVALITPLMHVKGYAAPETRAATERARILIEQAKRLGEPPEDSLLLFTVLYGSWAANLGAFNGDVLRHLAVDFLVTAEKLEALVPRMLGHRMMGISLLLTGDTVDGRVHLDRAIALYDPRTHRPLATRLGVDTGVSVLSYRAWARWMLGNPEAALADAERALKDAREGGQAATLMFALFHIAVLHLLNRDYSIAIACSQELFAIAEQKGASVMWKAGAMAFLGSAFALTGKAADTVRIVPAVLQAARSTGVTVHNPFFFSHLSIAHAELNQFDDAWRCIDEANTAVVTTNERWFEAELYRTAGEISLMSPKPDAAKAEEYFERALAVARQQQAKSWELRAAMSLARLWRDQGKPLQARELLAPVYGWFTEGFDTLDLKEAKALLEELAAWQERHGRD